MGTISRSNEKQLVLDYLNHLGLKASRNNQQFWEHIKNRHDKVTFARLDKAINAHANRQGTVEAIYNIKNSNLRLSLDVAHMSANLYRQYFDWFASRKGKIPKKILDLGCDNGLVTCFLGILYPEAEVFGIDRQEDAILCAKQLSLELGLKNVSFINSDVAELPKHFPRYSFDLITSLRSFHEILGGFEEPPRHWTTKELVQMDVPIQEQDYLVLIKELLRDQTSELVTSDRLLLTGELTMWVKTLQKAGLDINWDESKKLHFHEVGNEQNIPILALTQTPSHEDLLEQIYHFETKNKVLRITSDETYIEPLAEIAFHQIENKELLKGLHVNYNDGSGYMRLEIWKTPEYILVYKHTNIGFRELKVLDHCWIDDAQEELESVEPMYSPHAKTFFYQSLDEMRHLIL